MESSVFGWPQAQAAAECWNDSAPAWLSIFGALASLGNAALEAAVVALAMGARPVAWRPGRLVLSLRHVEAGNLAFIAGVLAEGGFERTGPEERFGPACWRYGAA